MRRALVFKGLERRQRWNTEQKRAIVLAVFLLGAVVTEVARRANVNSEQLYIWRNEHQDMLGVEPL